MILFQPTFKFNAIGNFRNRISVLVASISRTRIGFWNPVFTQTSSTQLLPEGHKTICSKGYLMQCRRALKIKSWNLATFPQILHVNQKLKGFVEMVHKITVPMPFQHVVSHTTNYEILFFQDGHRSLKIPQFYSSGWELSDDISFTHFRWGLQF